MTTALLEKQETISLADLPSDERKSRIYYNMPCTFTLEKGRKKKEVKGRLRGPVAGKIMIEAGKADSYEIDPSHVFVKPRKTLQKGDIIRAIVYTEEFKSYGDALLVLTQTNVPNWKAQTKSGEEVEIDPFYFYEPPLAPWQREEFALAADRGERDAEEITINSWVKDDRGQRGRVIERNIHGNFLIEWEDENKEDSWSHPKHLKSTKESSSHPHPPKAEASPGPEPNNKIKLGAKVKRAKGELAHEVGEVIEYNNVNGRWRVQWPDKRTWYSEKGLLLVKDNANPCQPNTVDKKNENVETGGVTKEVKKKNDNELEIGAIVFGEGQNGKGPAKIVNLPREEDGKIKIEWFAGNQEWMELESLQFTGDKTFVFLPLTEIKRNGGTQPRATLNSFVIEEYAEYYKEGKHEALPPLTVFYDGETYWLADGFHRAAALEQAGFHGARVDVRQGTRRDAQLHSFGVNAEHGLRRSPADKRRAVVAMLQDKEWVKWSNRAIAKHCKVSDMFVGKIRKELNPEEESTERTYEKNGKQTTMKTDNIGKSKAEAVERAAPPPSPSPPAAASEPEPEPEPTTSMAPPSPAPAAASEPEPESAASATSMTTPSPAPAAASEPEPAVSATTPPPAPAAASEPAVSAASMAPPSPAPAAASEPEPEPIENSSNEALAIRLEAEAFWERISDIRKASPEVKREFRSLLAEKLWK